MQEERFTIIGLGLMGGSLALALRPHVKFLAAVDIDPATLKSAADSVDLITSDLVEGVKEADVVILATPVRTILSILPELGRLRPEGCMVMDLGSTKVEVCRAMEALPANFRAIGGHPICGKETGGFTAASRHLFQRQTFVLCRTRRTDAPVEERALELVGKIGARPLFLPAPLHDKLLAATSHLPYAVAAVLVRSVNSLNDPRLWTVSASGFRDTSRLASSNTEMVLDILLTNRQTILSRLEKYQEEMTHFISLLESGDESALSRWLEHAQNQHAEYRESKERRGDR